jgi:hypothetical protein
MVGTVSASQVAESIDPLRKIQNSYVFASESLEASFEYFLLDRIKNPHQSQTFQKWNGTGKKTERTGFLFP